jgi:hypothetical protein
MSARVGQFTVRNSRLFRRRVTRSLRLLMVVSAAGFYGLTQVSQMVHTELPAALPNVDGSAIILPPVYTLEATRFSETAIFS